MDDDFDRFDDPLYAAARLEMDLADVERAIRMAGVRSLATSDLLSRLPELLEDDDRERILYRFSEVEFSEEEGAAFAESVDRLAREWEDLPSAEKARADAIVGRLIRSLPEPHRCRMALRLLSHRRKKRREGAYKILRGSGIPPEAISDVLALADASPDQQIFEIIARNPAAVVAADERYLLDEIEDRYWRMRVLAALLPVAPDRALSVGRDYPFELVHAIGRLEAREHLAAIRELFIAHRTDARFLSIYAWALGRIGDEAHLNEVRVAMETLRLTL